MFFVENEPVSVAACVVDLQAFTPFCLQEGAATRLNYLLRETFQHLAETFHLREKQAEAFEEASSFTLVGERPLHFKFLGDGALLLWRLPKAEAESRHMYLELVNRLHIVRYTFHEVRERAIDESGLPESTAMPPSIRVGAARGNVYRVTNRYSGTEEFVGLPLNLAARMEGYCKDLGFMASARDVPESDLEGTGFIRVETSAKPSGFAESESVIVDRLDFQRLNAKAKGRFNMESYADQVILPASSKSQ